jgi:hypothetical protein
MSIVEDLVRVQRVLEAGWVFLRPGPLVPLFSLLWALCDLLLAQVDGQMQSPQVYVLLSFYLSKPWKWSL